MNPPQRILLAMFRFVSWIPNAASFSARRLFNWRLPNCGKFFDQLIDRIDAAFFSEDNKSHKLQKPDHNGRSPIVG